MRVSSAIRHALSAVALTAASTAAAAHAQPSIWAEIAGRSETTDLEQLGRADAARIAGDYAQALDEVEALLAVAPDDPAAHALRLAALFGMQDDGAVDAAAAALADASPDAWADPRVAYFHALALARSGRISDAGERLEAAVRYRPDLAHAAFYLTAIGELRLAEGEPDVAALFFRQAMTADPGFAHARLGLAVTAALDDRPAEARALIAPVVLGGPDEDPLTRPDSTFFVPEGQRHLYAAVVAGARGERDAANEALDAWVASPAGREVEPDRLEALRDGLAGRTADVVVWATGCTSIGRMDIAPQLRRLAIRCDGQSLRVGRLDDGGPADIVPLTGLAWGQNTSGLAWAVVDVAWADETETLHVLYTSGLSESLEVDGAAGRSSGLIRYDGLDVVPVAFGEDPERVLWSGLWGAGVLVADRTTTPLTGSPSYLPSGQSVATGAVTRAGRVLVSGGYALEVLAGPAPWTQLAMHVHDAPNGPWTVGVAGDSIWVTAGGLLIERDLVSFAPLRFARLPDQTAEGRVIQGSPAAVEAVGPDEVWVAMGGHLVRVRFDAPR